MRYCHTKLSYYFTVFALVTLGALFIIGDLMAEKKLRTYQAKRNFGQTNEPVGTQKNRTSKNPLFVVQKHAASHLHYDLRLEHDGVLKSWAVPKGIPQDPAEKHLAIETEDHPLEYAHFEGVIPPGNYGAGTVEIWDGGTYKNITKGKNGQIIPVAECLKKGRLKVEFAGKKLTGIYVFIKTKLAQKGSWLIFKMADKVLPKATIDPDRVKINSHTIRLTHVSKILFPEAGITKSDLIDYYREIAPWMLPHTKDRYVTMVRAPEGLGGDWFYQKNMPASYPRWIKSVDVPLKEDGEKHMVVINNPASLVYLANQDCITPHISLSRTDQLEKPDRMIFDLDPSPENSFSQLCAAALQLKKILETAGLIPFVMTTGSRGLHIIVPIRRRAGFETVREYAHAIANQLVAQDPKNLTTEVRKNKRLDRIYVDTSRNAYGQTSVAPYAVRLRPAAPIAVPLYWEELADKSLTAQKYTIKNIRTRLAKMGDPWEKITQGARSLKKQNKKT